MTQDEVLKLLKKQYSEKFSHLCRDLFPTLLEKPDEFYNLITSEFAPNEYLYEDIAINQNIIQSFKNYIYAKAFPLEQKTEASTKTPAELLKEAGYTLYECKSNAAIQKFLKYYARGEELCTFKDNRLERCYVFFAVKDNVNEIIRENFKDPKRQDEYGTSVISIQFTRGDNNTLSIKNRYNHTVNNPDATFSNNLENIIQGLTDAFNRQYNLKSPIRNMDFEIDGYVRASDGKLYKYNYEIDNNYYCPNNIVIDNFEVKHFDKEKYIIMDNFILDIQKESRSISLYNKKYKDGFVDSIGKIDKVDVISGIEIDSNGKENKVKKVTINDNIIITLDKYNRIIRYNNPVTTIIDSNFLYYNKTLVELVLPKVKEIGHYCLYYDKEDMERVYLPEVEKIGNCFLSVAQLPKIDLPKVKEIGHSFMDHNRNFSEISFPNLEFVDDYFLSLCRNLKSVYLPKVKHIGDDFLNYTPLIKNISLPEVEYIGRNFMVPGTVNNVETIDLPKVKYIGSYFMFKNYCLTSINAPELIKVGSYFLKDNLRVTELNMPNLEYFGHDFFDNNVSMKKVNMPNIKGYGGYNRLFLSKSIVKEFNGQPIDCAPFDIINDLIAENRKKFGGVTWN